MEDGIKLKHSTTSLEIHINGEKVPRVPGKRNRFKMVQDGTHLCANGYEWKNGKWRRTLRALWNYWF